MDVHKAITVICVLNEKGAVESFTRLQTRAEILRAFFAGLGGSVHVVLEEGGWSAWLAELLQPLVASVLVCETRHSQRRHTANKSDDADAEQLARLLRQGELRPVYKGTAPQQQRRDLCRTYENLVEDATRTQNRLKALYRGRGIACAGHQVFRPDQRQGWLDKLPTPALQFRAATLLRELDTQQELRKQAKAQLLAAAQQHPDYARLVRIPGLGPVRVAVLLALVGTPHRFRTKRQFWTYCGFAVRTASSADYAERNGCIVKQAKKTYTRGLNQNFNRRLKAVFKGAAYSVRRSAKFQEYYESLVASGTKPELATLSVARKLASITLTLWQRQEDFELHKAFA
jgi:transposase